MSKDIYFINYYPNILQNSKNNTTFEFNNVIVKVPNKLGKDIYNIIDHNLSYCDVNGNLYIYNDDTKFKFIRLFVEDYVTIEKYTLSNNLEVKDGYLFLHCGDIALKIDHDIYDSDLFYKVILYTNPSVGKNIYVISLPKDRNDHVNERSYMTINIGNNNIIDFSDMKWFSEHMISIDNTFMDLYNELILGRI